MITKKMKKKMIPRTTIIADNVDYDDNDDKYNDHNEGNDKDHEMMIVIIHIN